MLPSEFTATVNADLTVGQLEETITVTGEAPVVDIRSSRAQVQLAQETLQALPGAGRSEHGLDGAARGDAETRKRPRGRRPERSDADGLQRPWRTRGAADHGRDEPPDRELDVRAPSSTTRSTSRRSWSRPSGVGADRDTGGMQLNMISKDGGNTFSGAATFAYVGPSLETQQHHRRAARPRARSAAGRVGQEVQGLGIRARRSDQARSPLVLRRGPRRRDAAVRGGRLLQQAHAAGIAALRARLEQAGVHRRFLQGLQCPIHVAGGGEAQDRARRAPSSRTATASSTC